jgi:hypothetical protein
MNEEDVKNKLAELVALREEQNVIDAWLGEQHPDEYARYKDIQQMYPKKVEEVKEAIRAYGQPLKFLDYKIEIQKKMKVTVDDEMLVAEAKERGDLHYLMERGVLSYSVNTDQIQRLEGEKRAIYEGFVTSTPATPAIYLPKELK